LVGAQQEFRVPRKPSFRYGVAMVSREYCQNHIPSDPRLVVGLLPYGDCSVIDEQRFHHFPLGIKTPGKNGFMMHADVKPAAERKTFLNLLVTFTVHKPTRMQAYMAAQEACAGRKCVLGPSWSDIIGRLWNLRVASKMSDFNEVLQDSVFTLAPSGNNPEQYRIWEAMVAGSIPIIEDLTSSWSRADYVSPAYGTNFHCTPQDSHYVLHVFRAPVFFVNDWRTDLPKLLAEMTPARIEKTQRDIAEWLLAMRAHYQVVLTNRLTVGALTA